MTHVLQPRRSPEATLRALRGAFVLGTFLLVALLPAWPQQNERPKRTLYSVLYTFTGGADGSNYDTLLPYDKHLILDAQGNLYGTVPSGGDVNGGTFSPCGEFGCGVVFKLDKSGKETVLYPFTGSPDGSAPVSTLFQDASGNLFGTTLLGGSPTAFSGTLFEVNHPGHETVLYSFTGGTDGKYPPSGLICDDDGNLYGVTPFGGDYSSGVVYKLDRTGKQTVLYSFTGGADGGSPFGALIRDQEGNLYGTTRDGGTELTNPYCDGGCGVVFKLTPAGKETVLYAFKGAPDGAGPVAGLIRDEEGNFYGATNAGGSTAFPCGGFGCGTVFKLTAAGHETVLYSFSGGADGESPYGSLYLYAGDLYGTTYDGGEPGACYGFGCGVVYKLSPAGKQTVLYTFTGGTDGANPDSGLIRDAQGNFYGTTESGGDNNPSACPIGCGVVFKLTPPEDSPGDSI
jgi:uncharacterized repeat protein (TIGR03803 family)